MGKRKGNILAIAAVAILMIAAVAVSPLPTVAQQVGDQVLISMKFVNAGVGAKGAGVLQTGELSTLSAAVASATRAEVVAAPATGSVYLRGVVIEKSAGATGVVTISYGTGTNCATSPTTIAAFTNPPIGTIPLGVAVASTKALCLTTEGVNTSARALTN